MNTLAPTPRGNPEDYHTFVMHEFVAGVPETHMQAITDAYKLSGFVANWQPGNNILAGHCHFFYSPAASNPDNFRERFLERNYPEQLFRVVTIETANLMVKAAAQAH